MLRLDLWEQPPVEGVQKEIFRVIRAAFANRRKTFANGLCIEYGKRLSKQAAEEILTQLGYESNVRGEALSLSDFAAVAAELQKCLQEG